MSEWPPKYCLKCHKKLSQSRTKNGYRLCSSCHKSNQKIYYEDEYPIALKDTPELLFSIIDGIFSSGNIRDRVTVNDLIRIFS